MIKLQTSTSLSKISPKEKKIYTFVENQPGCQSGMISEKLGIPLPTVKRILIDMVERKLLVKHGVGKGTNYTVETLQRTKKDLMLTLTNIKRKQEFLFMSSISLVEIKKILLTPLFEWKDPTEWGARLAKQNIGFKVTSSTNTGDTTELPARYFIGLISLHHFHPVATLNQPVTLSGDDIWGQSLKNNEYPVKVIIEIVSEGDITFDVRFVYDAMID